MIIFFHQEYLAKKQVKVNGAGLEAVCLRDREQNRVPTTLKWINRAILATFDKPTKVSVFKWKVE